MGKLQKVALVSLRIAIGWLFLYSGLMKVCDPNWTSAGFLTNAKNFKDLFDFMLMPGVLPVVDFLNAWGQLFIGASLVVGLLVPVSAVLGILLMILYYLAGVNFPYPSSSSFIVDSHIIYSLSLFVLFAANAGRYFGLDRVLRGPVHN